MKIFLFVIIASLAQLAHATPESIVPKTDLNFWNSDDVEGANNCYNYSTNRQTDTFAQPGEASDSEYKNFSCDDMIKAASKDLGLTLTPFFPFTSDKDSTLIALVIDPGNDFHWYRRDSNGLWSHKPGADPATTVDNSGEKITSPESADRGDYSDFCAYFKVNNYPSRPDQQNGGYVRIGNMSDLPDLPTFLPTHIVAGSEVEFLLYSGRRNPRMTLEKFMQNDAMKSLLKNISAKLQGATLQAQPDPSVKKEWESPQLGYNGIKIHDTQGLVFPKNSVVYLGRNKGYTMEYNHQIYHVRDPGAPQTQSTLRKFVESK